MKTASTLAIARKWLFLIILIGIVGGLGASAFRFLLDLCTDFFRDGLAVSFIEHNLLWLIVALPLIGGLAVGVLQHKWDKEAFRTSCGTDAVIAAIHEKEGALEPKRSLLKILTASLTIGSGGSAGRECPAAFIGTGLGSAVGSVTQRLKMLRKLVGKLAPDDLRTISLCGASAGIGSIFIAPLGGGMFASEVLYKGDVEMRSLVPCMLASVTGALVAGILFKFEPLIKLPGLPSMVLPKLEVASSLGYISIFALVGVACGLTAVVFVKSFYRVHEIFLKSRIPGFIRPSIGGLIDGLFIIAVLMVAVELLRGEVLGHGLFVWGMGYWVMEAAIAGELLLMIMILLIPAKILATSFTVGSAGAGGLIIPSFFVGAMIGGSISAALALSLPGLLSPEVYPALVVAGMCSLYGAAGRVPMATVLLVCESCRNFSLLLPLILSTSVAFIVVKAFGATLYTCQKPCRPRLTKRRRVVDVSIWLCIVTACTLLYYWTGIVL